MKFKTLLMDEDAVRRAIMRIAHEIMEKNAERREDVLLVGIRTRGVPLANQIKECIKDFDGMEIPVGILDITLYRDDLSLLSDHPVINGSELPFSIENKRVVLIDDVIYTGRTVRAAIEALMEVGRPKMIQLAALVDRGHRELPIRADFVGKNVPTSRSEVVAVNLFETDGETSVRLYDRDTD